MNSTWIVWRNGELPLVQYLVHVAIDFGTFNPAAGGLPPGKFVGGVVGIEKGMHVYFEADLAPGQYGLLCFFPDEKGGPHFKRGMALDFTVK